MNSPKIKIQEETNIIIPKILEKEIFLYHTIIWQKFIKKCFQIEQTFITARNDKKEIISFLPISKIKSFIFGNRIIAVGYQEYGGMVGDNKNLIDIITFIQNKYSNDFEFCEIRGAINEKNNPQGDYNLYKKSNYKRFILNLTTEDETFKKIQKSKRKAIKKSEKTCMCRELTIKDIDQFYKLYLQNMRLFGSPPYSKKYFINFFNIIKEKQKGKIYGSFKQDKLVSALLGFFHHERVHITTAISNPKFASLRPSDLMHWTFIKWAINNNYKVFDFGLVREESGQFEYKRKWGAELFELPHYLLPLKKKDLLKSIDPKNKKYG